MKIYLVGGAVRDELLKLPGHEKDWVVVGATENDIQEMIAKGYKQVGKDFPVFLHPETHEEYALARTERKTGRGYTAFDFNASPNVTLEEDLMRRDLTINAIAKSADGKLIDPYHGQKDLSEKILRHVSKAFIEDPVRILRVARFAARFPEFSVAPETLQLMKEMVSSGEVNALVSERVFKELERALSEKNPEIFFEVLNECGALAVLFPEIKKEQIKMLARAAEKTDDSVIRFAVLFYGLSRDDAMRVCERFRVPTEYRDLAVFIADVCNEFKKENLPAEIILDLLQKTDAFRREERFEKFLLACEICLSQSLQRWRDYFNAAKKVDVQKIISETQLTGKELAEKIKEKRIEAIKLI